MKKTVLMLMVLSLLLALCACQSSAPKETPGLTEPSVPETGFTEDTLGQDIYIQQGQKRISWDSTGDRARYITSPNALPDYEEFQQYDEAFFQNHALVLVSATATNGGQTVVIESIRYEGQNAIVTLRSTQAEGDANDAMYTWLLWKVVDAGLDYTWKIAGELDENELPRL